MRPFKTVVPNPAFVPNQSAAESLAPFVEEPISASAAFAPEQSGEPPLPPAPKQMNNPVGPPPPPAEVPKDYDGFMELALSPRTRADFKTMWLQAAQADATKQVADHLGVIAEFLGAYGEDGESDPTSPRLELLIAEVLAAVTGKKLVKYNKKAPQ